MTELIPIARRMLIQNEHNPHSEMPPYAKNWTFTINNYTEDDVNRLNNLINARNTNVAYLIYGKEVGENGTPHLQGFVHFSNRKTFVNVKSVIGSNPHIEIARNTHASIQYCKKDGDWTEHGSMQDSSGQRTDLEDFKADVKNGMLSLKDIREKHSKVYSKYTRFCREYVEDNFPQIEVAQHTLRDWQRELKTKLEGPADRRKIIFVVDHVGNTGKSWFAHYYTRLLGEKAQVLLPGKKSDMAYILKPMLKVVFMDAPRSKQGEFIQYDFLEDLKNGYIFSNKYESTIKTYEPLHVVVNMNEEPDMTKLSEDRYDIIYIRQYTNGRFE
jgi:Putative viral replication protein